MAGLRMSVVVSATAFLLGMLQLRVARVQRSARARVNYL